MDHAQLLDVVQRADKHRKDAQDAWRDAVIAALKGGVPLADLIVAGDTSRESLRRIARDADVPLRRAPTVISNRKPNE